MLDEQPTINNQPTTAEDWQAKAEEYLAGWKRAMADYQNREREIVRERNEIAAIATRGVILDFLPILDNLRAANAHAHTLEHECEWAAGLSHVIRQFEDMLKACGVAVMATVGEPFDPSKHEAIGEEPGEKPGAVLREVQGGYFMNNKVLRPARVIITKN